MVSRIELEDKKHFDFNENLKSSFNKNANSLPTEHFVNQFISPDLPSRCKWHLNHLNVNEIDNPHEHRLNEIKPRILENILHHIGNTPMIRLDRIKKYFNLKYDLYAKCEFFNPGGSIKDRIGYRMVIDAKRDGILKPGATIIEPTSGNTGIGIALASAVLGYNCIIVMPEKMSNEKVNVLRALGAEIIRTPTSARYDAPNSHISVAQKLRNQITNSIILDQYRNPSNPLAHYDHTAEEILMQTDSKIDMIVMGAGTGGTVTGVARKLKEKIPDCKIVAVDPVGSILAEPEELNQTETTFYEVEGIGYDFVPTVLDRSIVDRWIKTDDKESLPLARMLIKMEGLLCGGSSGSALAGALKAGKELKDGQKCVVILPDGVRNYMTKFLDDDWLAERNIELPFKMKEIEPQNEPWFYDHPIKELISGLIVKTIKRTATCMEAIQMMKEYGFDQMPVVKDGTPKNILLGMVTVNDIMSKLAGGQLKLDTFVEKVLTIKYAIIMVHEPIRRLIKLLSKNPFVVVVEKTNEINNFNTMVAAILTHIDLLNYYAKVDQN